MVVVVSENPTPNSKDAHERIPHSAQHSRTINYNLTHTVKFPASLFSSLLPSCASLATALLDLDAREAQNFTLGVMQQLLQLQGELAVLPHCTALF